jgi:peptidoglycan DL-endopeptidase CwlO
VCLCEDGCSACGRATMRRATLTSVSAAAALTVAMVAGTSAAAPGPSPLLRAKEARAQAVLAQVGALDRQFEQVVEAWDGARVELGRSRAQLDRNQAALVVAERQSRRAQRTLQQRAVSLYEGQTPTTIDVIVGSTSLGDMLDRLQAAQDVAASDARVVRSVTESTQRLRRTRAKLQRIARVRAVALAQLNANRAEIGTMLAKRRTLLASVQAEVATIRERERRQQLALAAAARARVARQVAAAHARVAAAARADAAAQVAARNAPQPAAAVVTTPTHALTPTTPPATTAAAPASPTTSSPAPVVPPVSVPVAPAPPVVSAGAGHPEAAAVALQYLGVRYAWGGSTPAGFDCSGLVMYVYAQLGIQLPHYAADQYLSGTPISRSSLQPGDLVFFDGLSHVGIYIGNGQMVHAPHTGDVVRISNLSEFDSGYVGARRI